METALIVLDGWGLGDHDRRDAVKAADTPVFDRLWADGASGQLTAHGRTVGLPDGQMGNSEVGHQHLGAGRVIEQAVTRIDDAIAADELADREAIRETFAHADRTDSRVHLVGLVSDGGVHASQRHMHALIRAAGAVGVETVTHAITDGRDTPPRSGRGYLAELTATALDAGTGEVATVVGRYHAMDRDENWDRTARAYRAMVGRDAPFTARSPVRAVEAGYDRDESDEFLQPTVIDGTPGIEAGDAVLWTNFRADRARQLTRMLAGIEPTAWAATGVDDPPAARITTMTEYDETFDLPVVFPPVEPSETLGEVVSRAGMQQVRLAESEKYPHVTYFLNGGRETVFDGEHREIVQSPDVETYDHAPAMSASAVTDEAIAAVETVDPALLVVNYANPDMVGHTGDFGAAVTAVETVDRELGRLAEAIHGAGGSLLVTADHGNADDMGTPNDPHTAHTTAPTPVVFQADGGTAGGHSIREGGDLTDVAPTLLELLGVPVPDAMTGQSLLVSTDTDR